MGTSSIFRTPFEVNATASPPAAFTKDAMSLETDGDNPSAMNPLLIKIS